MKLKRMLITGASKGIGKECADFFKSKYELVTIARSGEVTYKGDLTDKAFLDSLVSRLEIDILINGAGVIDDDFYKTFEVNVMASSYLAVEFYKKMKSGHIINITSTAANFIGWKGMPDRRIWYHASKAALRDLTQVMQNSRRNNVKITNLEPGWVNTGFDNSPQPEDYTAAESPVRITPMGTSYIAETIDWILSQPPHVNVNTLQIDNFYNPCE